MRVICHMGPSDVSAIEKGKPIVISAAGVDTITVHFDPAEEAPAPPEQPPAKKNKELLCDCCNRPFPTKHSLNLHKGWMKRKAKAEKAKE